MASKVDGWASDYLRQLNTQGPGNPGNIVSSKVQYVPPVVQTEARTNDTPMYTGDDARGAYVAPASGYRAPAGGGWNVNSSDTNLRFPNESGGRRYARSKRTQSRSRGSAPANGVKTRSAPLSGADVTADVLRSVKAAGNTSFANWRQSLVNQGWSQAEADAVRYDPSTGKFMSNASGQAATDHYMREQADKDAGIMADNPEVEGKVSGQTPAGQTPARQTPAGQTPAKTEGSAQPAPAKTEGSAQPAPASGAQSDAEIEQLRAQMRAEVNKLRGFGDFGNNAIALAQQWGDKILSNSGKSDVEQMQEMIKQLQYWNSIAPGIVKMNPDIVKMNGGN